MSAQAEWQPNRMTVLLIRRFRVRVPDAHHRLTCGYLSDQDQSRAQLPMRRSAHRTPCLRSCRCLSAGWPRAGSRLPAAVRDTPPAVLRESWARRARRGNAHTTGALNALACRRRRPRPGPGAWRMRINAGDGCDLRGQPSFVLTGGGPGRRRADPLGVPEAVVVHGHRRVRSAMDADTLAHDQPDPYLGAHWPQM